MDIMNFVRRLTNGLLGFALGGIGLTMLISATQQSNVKWAVDFSAFTLAWSGGGAALCGFALLWLSVSRFQLLSRRIVISQGNPGSDFGANVAVSPSSVDEILHYATLDHESIRGCKSRVRLENGCWQVHCDLWVSPAASLLAVSQELETEIRQTLMHHTGIPVGNLDFTIDITSKA